MMHRWRVKIKVYNKSYQQHPHDRSLPVYECTKWYDSEPDPYQLLDEVMNQDRHKADHFYGEATKEQVWHTHRTQYTTG